MKPFQTSMNIIKWTPYFPGFVLCHVLVACCLMMVGCNVESMIRGYHKYNYISKLSLESELDLLKYCNIDILTLILMQNKLKCTSRCYAHLVLQKQENWQKTDSLNSPKFFPLQSFLCCRETIVTTIVYMYPYLCIHMIR